MLAVTSLYEGFSMVILEAEACGLPVVSFDCRYGPSDLVHDGVNGYLVDVGDVKGLAEKIITLAKDEVLRRSMGMASLENSKNYTPSKIAAKWSDFLNKLCS